MILDGLNREYKARSDHGRVPLFLPHYVGKSFITGQSHSLGVPWNA